MLSILSRAIEARDEYTRGHSSRVTAIAESIALRLGWDEERLDLLQLGGPLHDAGQLPRSHDVFPKPRRLLGLRPVLFPQQPWLRTARLVPARCILVARTR